MSGNNNWKPLAGYSYVHWTQRMEFWARVCLDKGIRILKIPHYVGNNISQGKERIAEWKTAGEAVYIWVTHSFQNQINFAQEKGQGVYKCTQLPEI